MSSTAGAASETPRQNWVVGVWSDMLFIVAAPLFALVWTLGTMLALGPERGTTVVLATFGVFNVAHHFPTFIRIYGDKDLIKRFRWSLLLGPIFPFGFAMLVCAMIIRSGASVYEMLFLFMILTLWDPWHFIMQHYGFMRIYDRHNAAPRKLASRMDLLLCATWFAFMMTATAEWLPTILYELHAKHGVDLLLWFNAGTKQFLERLALVIAIVSTIAYVWYLVWCRMNGYYISGVKLALMLITFGVMYFTYVPNAAMESLVVGWTFPVGFATLGMVHVTQYLAIVWKYNRSLASRHDGSGAREGFFRFRTLFRHGGLLLSSAYVITCLLYGAIISGSFVSDEALPLWATETFTSSTAFRWGIGILISLLFTSNFLHYYFDGFIWKVRHRENRQNLAMSEEGSPTAEQPVASWWDSAKKSQLGLTIVKQTVYFVPPILFLMVTYWFVQDHPEQKAPMTHLMEQLPARARGTLSDEDWFSSVDNAYRQLAIESHMADLSSDPKHKAYKADLTYNLSTADLMLKSMSGSLNESDLELHLRQLQQAKSDWTAALESEGSIAHRERLALSAMDEAEQKEEVRKFIDQIDGEIASIESGFVPNIVPSS